MSRRLLWGTITVAMLVVGCTGSTPTASPTAAPTDAPTAAPTEAPTPEPTDEPTDAPTEAPTTAPTDEPTTAPTEEPTAPPETVTLRVAAVAPGAVSWTLYAGTTHGFFEREGLDVQYDYTFSAPGVTQQLTAGEIEIGNVIPDNFIRGVEAGADLVMVAADQTMDTMSLFVDDTIDGFEGLRGETIMIGGAEDPSLYMLRSMLRPNGLEDDDYELSFTGSTPDRLVALQSGAVHATILLQPFDFIAENDGYTRLVSQWDHPIDYQFIAVGVRRDWAEENRDVLIRYLRAYRDALEWLNDPANEAEAVDLLVVNAETGQDEAQKTYDLYMELGVLPADARLTDQNLLGVMTALDELGALPDPAPEPTKYYDHQYLDAAGE
jgi:ABC-type nitrate/sulfonate/bicarbonate transport system substrate-binding protein